MSVWSELRDRARHAGKVTFAVKVIPKSAKSELAGVLADGTLRIRIAAVPEKGKANDELCRFVAQQLDVSRSSIEVLRGHTSQRKLLRVRA